MEPPESGSLCNRIVTGNSNLDNWIWIIEYLAKYKSELWMLHDVFEMAPTLPDDLGEYTNEMVAFRCLASLYDSDVVVVVSDANSKIEFDSSESCVYVLQCILDEIPLSELKPGAPGLSKWNLLPFIKSKLLCLPKCAFELMIEPSSCEKDTDESPCKGSESMRSNGKEDVNVTPRMADSEDEPGDEANETNSSDALLERRHDGFQYESDGHVSSPLEDNRYRCVQCKEGRKLLFCSKDCCTVMVHEKCLDSPPFYDDAGDFYCSPCALTCASAAYLQSLDEVAKAKKKLVSFLSLMSKVNKKKSIEGTSNTL